jgi:sulfur carrier protein ThiS
VEERYARLAKLIRREVMRALIGSEDCQVKPGAKLSELVKVYEKKLSNDPMIQTIKKKSGKSYLIFIVNGVVIHPDRFDQTVLKDGDDVRILHPYFGG